MIHLLRDWLKVKIFNPEILVMLLTLVGLFVVLITMNKILAPVFASIVIAYLLDGLIAKLERRGVPHFISVLIVYLLSLSLVGIALFGLFPLLWHQASNLLHEVPDMLTRAQGVFAHLPDHYPEYISADQLHQLLKEFKLDFSKIGQTLLIFSINSITNFVTLLIYFILVPLLVYFFVMDKTVILNWAKRFLPGHHQLLIQVWDEVHNQIGNYVRGRVIEIIIVGVICYIPFALLGLRYAALLAAFVGVSAIVPYLGAVVVTVPIFIIAFLQWGWSSHLAYLSIIYCIINILDGNVLVPLLFSEAVAIHPVAIIVAVLFFGGLWGFWGVFFAIPLASLVKSVVNILQSYKALPAQLK